MKIKLIASDIDGTIINSDHQVTEMTKDAVHRLRKHGIHFMLSTGRSFEGAFEIAKQLELDNENIGMICLNGMHTYNLPEKTVKIRESLSFEECIELQKLGEKYFMGILYCFEDCIYLQMDDLSYKDYTIAVGEEAKNFFNFAADFKYVTSVYDIKDLFETKPIQKIAYIQSPDYMELVIDRMREQTHGAYQMMRVGEGWTEVGQMNISKGTALLEYAKELGIQPEEIMVFGDSENDISMFNVAGVSVAMENAIGMAKMSANAFTLSNDEDGVGVFIDAYLNEKNLQI